ASTPELAWAAAKHGEVVYILELLPPLHEEVPLPQRASAASLLGKLVLQPIHGPREQMKGRVFDWDMPEQASSHQEMRDEPQDPKFPLRNPKRFLEGLLDQYLSSIAATHHNTQGSDPELPLLLSAALVSLFTTGNDVLKRIANARCTTRSTTCTKAMAATSVGTTQVVPLLMKAIRWQGGSILALEMLKRVVVAGNKARDALVALGLRVGLIEVLLGLLDWRAGGRNGLCSQMKWNESKASIGRVLVIELKFGYIDISMKNIIVTFCDMHCTVFYILSKHLERSANLSLINFSLIRGCKMGGVGNSLIESAVWTPEEVLAAKGVKPTLSPKLDTLALVEEQRKMHSRGSQNNKGMENLHHQNLKQTVGKNKILDHYIASGSYFIIPFQHKYITTHLIYFVNFIEAGFLMERPVTVHNAIAGLIIMIMVNLIIKELPPALDEFIIVTRCHMKDMNDMSDAYRANAIRNLCRIIDGTLLTQIKRYTRDCEKMEQ
nr:DnaJ homolog subfamily C GRV2 isoform X1 [Tanacetum cinerariifolium]